MTTEKDSYRFKARAVFLAAIMVLSMAAIGFAATPAAAQGNSSVNIQDVDLSNNLENNESDYTVTNNFTEVDDGDPDGEYIHLDFDTSVDYSSTADTDNVTVILGGTELGANSVTAPNNGELLIELSDAIEFDSVNEDQDGELVVEVDSLMNDVAGDYDTTIDIREDDGTTSITSDTLTDAYTITDDPSESTGAPDVDRVFDDSGDLADSLVYQGQTFAVYTGQAEGTEIQLRRVTSGSVAADDRRSTVVSTGTVDSNGWVQFSTTNRQEGDYFLRGDGVHDTDEFEIVIQDIDASFAEDEVENAGDTFVEFEIDSDLRNTYDVEIFVDGFDEDDYEQILQHSDFPASVTGAQITENDDGDDVLLVENAEGVHDLNFSGIEAGDYEFEVDVTDTTAEDTDSITVVDTAEGDVGFVQSTVTQNQGDVVSFDVEFTGAQEYASIAIGEEEEVGYQLDAVVDSDGEDEVTVYFNSYEAANENADIEDIIWVDEEDSDAAVIESEELGDEVDGLLDEGDYDVYVADGNQWSEKSDQDDWDEAVIDDSSDILLLTLTERSTDAINSWTAPRGAADDIEELDDIVEAVDEGTLTATDNIAKGDTIALELEASGLSGLLGVEADGDVSEEFQDALDDDAFDLEMVQQNPRQNRRAIHLNQTESADAWTVIADAESDTYYLIADTGDLRFQRGADSTQSLGITNDTLDMRDGANFETDFTVSDSALLDVDPNERRTVADDEDDFETVSTDVTFNDREGEFNQDPLNVTNAEGQEFAGTTTVAPGSEVNVRASATQDTQPRFVKTSTVEVSADRTWSASLDFSEQSVGDTFEARAGGAFPRVTVDGTVVEAADTPTPTEETDTPTPTEETDTPTPTEETDTPTPTEETETPEDTDETTPGFGAVVGLIALIAAALLAVRRRP